MPTAHAQLELPPAVHQDPALVAVVVGVQQALDAARARGLDVDHLGWEGQRLDVGDVMDRRVPGDPVAVIAQKRVDLAGELGVLDPGVGEGLDDAAV